MKETSTRPAYRKSAEEPALNLAPAEMFVQGVSTRRVDGVTEQLCDFSVTACEVCLAARALDEHLQAWRERPLGAHTYVYLDARCEKVRNRGSAGDLPGCAVAALPISTAEERRLLRPTPDNAARCCREPVHHFQRAGRGRSGP